VRATGPAPASEDFGSFGAEWHTPLFWFVGGTDPDRDAKARGGPAQGDPDQSQHPTLQMGAETLIVAARAWLAP